MKEKVLIIAKTSDYSETGFYKMNRYVLNSKVLEALFTIRNFNLISSKSGILLKWVRFIHNILSLCRTVLLFKPSLIYFTISPKNAFYRDFVFVLVIRILGNSKIVYHLHGKGIQENRVSRLNSILYTYAYRNVSVICLSELLKFDFEGLPIHNFYILGNAIENCIKILPKRIINDVPQILFLSNFIRSKGIFDLIEALSILKSKNVAFKCLLTGQEYDVSFTEIEQLLKDRKLLEVVVITGPKYGREKTELLLASDILVHPTLEDVWGLVILEAMEAGKPVVSTYEGAIPEIIDNGVTGYIVEKNNPEELGAKIEAILNDCNLRIKMGQAGRNKFEENYTIEKFENKLGVIFTKIIEN